MHAIMLEAAGMAVRAREKLCVFHVHCFAREATCQTCIMAFSIIIICQNGSSCFAMDWSTTNNNKQLRHGLITCSGLDNNARA